MLGLCKSGQVSGDVEMFFRGRFGISEYGYASERLTFISEIMAVEMPKHNLPEFSNKPRGIYINPLVLT